MALVIHLGVLDCPVGWGLIGGVWEKKMVERTVFVVERFLWAVGVRRG